MSTYEVDSFKIRIPYSKITIVNESISGKWITVNSNTGEVDPYAYKENSYRINDNGIKTKYGIEGMRISASGVDTFVTILVNSKTLRRNYLSGITQNNIKSVYNYLISQKVVDFTFNDFLNSDITDVDFKKDVVRYDVNMLISGLYSLTRDNVKDRAKKYLKKHNKGVEWSKRDTIDINKPFLKIYHKGLELKNNSKDFYGNHLTDKKYDELDNTVRIEFTIKNKKHFRKYGIEDTKLKTILALSKEIKTEMLLDTAKKHLDLYEVQPVKIKTKLNPNDRIILTCMNFIVVAKLRTSEKLIDELTEDIEDRSQKSKKRNELKVLYEKHLKPYMMGYEKDAKLREEVLQLLI